MERFRYRGRGKGKGQRPARKPSCKGISKEDSDTALRAMPITKRQKSRDLVRVSILLTRYNTIPCYYTLC